MGGDLPEPIVHISRSTGWRYAKDQKDSANGLDISEPFGAVVRQVRSAYASSKRAEVFKTGTGVP